MEKVRSATTNSLFESHLPMEEVLKGCINPWYDIDQDKANAIEDKKAIKEEIAGNLESKTLIEEPNKKGNNRSE